MQHIKNLFSRHCYRHIPFWLLLLISLYSAVGFLLAPYLIKKTLVEQVEANLGWQANVEKVQVNPYTFTLNIEQLSIVDENKNEVIGFSRLYTDFTLRSAFEFAFTFEKIELVDPRFELTINKDGSTNIQQALAAHVTTAPEIKPEEDNLDSAIVPLLIDNIIVENGGISVTNHQPATAIVHEVKPITFNLQNFSTRPDEDGEYKLDIALGTGQTLHWKGLISLNPVRSSGSLNVSGIKVHKFWPYIESSVPYHLAHGLASVTGKYEMSLLDKQLALKVEEAVLDVEKIKFTSESLPDGFIDIQHINIGPSHFDLQAKTLSIKQLLVDQLTLNVLRDKQGQLTMLSPLKELDKSKEATSSQAKASDTDKLIASTPINAKKVTAEKSNNVPFTWSIDKVALTNSQVNWLDKQPKQASTISIKKLNVELHKLNQDLATTLPFSIDYLINESKKNQVKGDLVIKPFTFNSHLILDDVDLTMAQPYISELAKVKLEKGLLSVNADFKLKEQKNGEITSEFAGGININNFNTRDTVLNKRLVGWQDLSIKPLKINTSPLAIDIDKIAFSKAYFRVVVGEDRSLNLSKLSVQDKQSKEKKSAPKQHDKKEPVVPIRIGEVSLKESSAFFADLSLRPQFSTGVEHINGKVSGLSSKQTQRANIDIKGKVEDDGSMLIKGQVNPFSGNLYTDVNVKFNKIDLTTWSPYSGRFMGYQIDKGKLSLGLDYKIDKHTLKADNRVILDQFELGHTVKSKEAVNLPIKLALALFKDKDGVIDIDLPISGNLDDPDFKISGVLMKTFSNLITKAAISPFSAVAGLVDGDVGKLNSVAFSLGNSELDDLQKENLKTLADILKERPNLVLEVRAIVDQEAEGYVLKEQQLKQFLTESDIDIQDVDELENLYIQRKSSQALENLQQESNNSVVIEQQKSEDKWSEEKVEATEEERYQEVLYHAVVDSESLSSIELSTLAKQRIRVIKRELINTNKVPNAQVFVLNPLLTGKAEQEKVQSKFTLNSK
ncbi:DUF748 domain-containing protein [Psychromonas algarum]|uniref:DUF748 domain-containing protein n=1 Tax=Psychromonas algarum TaxID=2555643 RepID=UPI00141A4C15|nr:DUF748 domain-containing protein [Psychromonas sp. RZ22]